MDRGRNTSGHAARHGPRGVVPLMSESRPRAEGCQGASRRRRTFPETCGASGRGTPEKDTRSRIALASPGPMPRTRCSPAIDPNTPKESRFATIRRASAGPIRGRDSSAAISARSMSITAGTALGRSAGNGATPADRGQPVAGDRPWAALPLVLSPRFFRRFISRLGELATAESTRAIWAASSRGDPAITASPPRVARHALTPIPSAAMAAKKRSACRSAGVGMAHDARHPTQTSHRNAAVPIDSPPTVGAADDVARAYRNSASATSPTIFSDFAEILSIVSCNEWW